jgi:hypothetical protein
VTPDAIRKAAQAKARDVAESVYCEPPADHLPDAIRYFMRRAAWAKRATWERRLLGFPAMTDTAFSRIYRPAFVRAGVRAIDGYRREANEWIRPKIKPITKRSTT